MELLVAYLSIALFVSFACSIFEAVLLSISPAYIWAQEKEGKACGPRLRRFKEDIDRPLAAILSLNTIAHTVGAAGVGAQSALVFGNEYVGLSSGLLTLMILVFSEIIPKTLGAVHWRTLAPFVARALGPLIVITYPLVRLAQGLTRLLQRRDEQPGISRDELRAMAELGAANGTLEAAESKMLQTLLQFRTLHASDIMTPRTVVFALPETETVGVFVEQHQARPFSRIPLFGEAVDDVTGYVMRDDILHRAALGQPDTPLSELRRPIGAIPAMLPLPHLLERLLGTRAHIALVVDEFGGTAGIVTLEDLVETLIGTEIVDESDLARDMQKVARAQWERRARKLGLVRPPEDDEPPHDDT